MPSPSSDSRAVLRSSTELGRHRWQRCLLCAQAQAPGTDAQLAPTLSPVATGPSRVSPLGKARERCPAFHQMSWQQPSVGLGWTGK